MLTWLSDRARGDVGEQPGPVERLHLDGGHEHARVLGVPLDLDEPLALPGRQRHGVGAVGPVHRHAAAPGDEPDDLVAGHRRAALRQPDHDVVEALDVDADVWRSPATARRGWRTVVGQLLLDLGIAAPQLRLAIRAATDFAETWSSPMAAWRASRSA